MASVTWRKNRVKVNGNDYIGQIEEGSCEIKREFSEAKGLGMPGTAKLPNGRFEAITAKIKFNNIMPRDIRRLIKNDGFVSITFSGQAMFMDAIKGLNKDSEMTTTLRGYTENIPGQDPKNEGTSEHEVTINLLFIEMKDKDGRVLLIDLPNGLVEPEELA